MQIFLSILILGILLQACGQTGPLYHPDESIPTDAPKDQDKQQK